MSEPNEMTEEQLLEALSKGPEGTGAAQNDPGPSAQEQDVQASEEAKETSQVQPEESTEDAPEAGTEPAKGKEPGQTDKPQTREAKEQARVAKTWEKINADKAALAREREEVAKAREEIERAKGEAARKQLQSPEPLRDERGFTAEEYEAAAKRWKDDGADEQAILAAQNAAQALRAREQHQISESYHEALKHVQRENPDLLIPVSPLATATREILAAAAKQKHNPYNHLDGFAQAVEHAKLQVRAGSVPALEKKITELNKEVERLTKLSSPARGNGTRQVGSGSNGQLTEEDVLAALQEQDRQRMA